MARPPRGTDEDLLRYGKGRLRAGLYPAQRYAASGPLPRRSAHLTMPDGADRLRWAKNKFYRGQNFRSRSVIMLPLVMDNEHAYLVVRFDFLRGCASLSCPDHPEI